MKQKPLFLLLMVVGMMTITARAVQAQESSISFIDEEGYTVSYDLSSLIEMISTSDTLMDHDRWFMEEYESVFPSKRGPREPAILVLLPVDDYFYSIFIQENKRGKLLAFRALTRDGWLEASKEDLEILKNYVRGFVKYHAKTLVNSSESFFVDLPCIGIDIISGCGLFC